LAAMMVFVIHFIRIFSPAFLSGGIANSPLKFLIDGDAAVLYFFILSGFVLTKSIQNTDISLRSYLKFSGRRFLRIYPAFLFTLLLTFLLFPLFAQTNAGSWLNGYWKTYPVMKGVWEQAILIYRIPNDPTLRLLPHDWTLSVEMVISLLLPLLVLLSRKSVWLMVILTYIAVRVLPVDPFVLFFALGVLIAFQEEFLKAQWKKISFLGHVIFAILTVLFIEAETLSIGFSRILNLILLNHKAWGMAFLLIGLISSESIQKLLSINPLKFIGKISYSFYLWHFVLLAILFQNSVITNPVVNFGLSFGITIVVSSVSFFLIERPFLLLSKKWLKD
jgi:peptidoglycan/LPS O-acetylase OafA/YrhL